MARYRPPLGVDGTCRTPFFLCPSIFLFHSPLHSHRFSPLLYVHSFVCILIVLSYLMRLSLYVILHCTTM
jgi:hypothetical protein